METAILECASAGWHTHWDRSHKKVIAMYMGGVTASMEEAQKAAKKAFRGYDVENHEEEAPWQWLLFLRD